MPSLYKSSELPGTIRDYGGELPPNYLLCDGSSLLKVDFPALFTAIGLTWGGGVSSFNLPDSRGRNSICSGIAISANRVVGQNNIGAETVQLNPGGTEGHVNNHTHTGNVGTINLRHQHSLTFAGSHGHRCWDNIGDGVATPDEDADNDEDQNVFFYTTVERTDHYHGLTGYTATHDHTLTVSYPGTANVAHNNLHPQLVVTKMIRF